MKAKTGFGYQAWLACALGLALTGSFPLRAEPQGVREAGAPTSSQAPLPASSALKRWWQRMGRHHVILKTDEQGTLLIEAGGGLPERIYRASREADGRFRESYQENGEAKPVDEAVRGWAQATLQAARQAVPPPPAPPPPPEPPPAPPAPPAPPVPPPFGTSETGQSLLRAVQNDPRVATLLGTPTALGDTPKGSITSWAKGEPHGFHLFSAAAGAKVDIAVPIQGPKGSALLRVTGTRSGDQWRFSRLEVEPLGGPPLNLLAR